MDKQSLPTGTWSLKDDISLCINNPTISKIFFVIGLVFPLLCLHHACPSTPLAIFLLLLMILLCKALWDFFFICFFVCPHLWTLIVFLSYAWWYLRALL